METRVIGNISLVLLVGAILTNCVFGFFWKKAISGSVPPALFALALGASTIIVSVLALLAKPQVGVRLPPWLGVVSIIGALLIIAFVAKSMPLIIPARSIALVSLCIGLSVIGAGLFYLYNGQLFIHGNVSQVYPLVALSSIILLTVSGWLFLNEAVTPTHVAGVLIGIGSFVLLKWF